MERQKISKNKAVSIAFTGAAAALVAGLPAGQATAAGAIHIKNQGTGYAGAVKGKNNGAVTLKFPATGATIPCNAAWSASVPHSTVSGTSPVALVFKTMDLSGCTIGGVIPLTGKNGKIVDYHVTGVITSGVTGYLGTKGASKAISLTLLGVGNNCRARITGSTIPASYLNPPHSLILDKARTTTLTVKSAASCGVLHTGSRAYMSGKVHISIPSDLTIS